MLCLRASSLIRNAWDNHKSTARNLQEMGLAFDPNRSLPIKKTSVSVSHYFVLPFSMMNTTQSNVRSFKFRARMTIDNVIWPSATNKQTNKKYVGTLNKNKLHENTRGTYNFQCPVLISWKAI